MSHVEEACELFRRGGYSLNEYTVGPHRYVIHGPAGFYRPINGDLSTAGREAVEHAKQNGWRPAIPFSDWFPTVSDIGASSELLISAQAVAP